MTNLRAAVIGLGSMGINHARVYAEIKGVELVAVTDTDAERARSAGKRYGVPSYVDYREMLSESTPTIVSVAVPTRQHCDVVTGALTAGCHVLVEKPIAATVEEAQAMIDLAAKAERVLGVGHIERFNPVIMALRRAIEAGEIGDVLQIVIRRIGPKPNRPMDVGVFLDLATHDVDILCYVTGSSVTHLTSESIRTGLTSHEDLGVGVLRLANGSLGILIENWLSPTKIRDVTVTGTGGMLVADTLTQDLYQYDDDYESTQWIAIQNLRGMAEGRMIRHRLQKGEPLRVELEAFARSVIEGVPFPVTGNDGLRALELALRLRTASQTDKVAGASDEISPPSC